MVIFLSVGGQTGNHLFQLAYMLSFRRKREYLITAGFGRARKILSPDVRRFWINFESSVGRLAFARIIEPLLYHLLYRTGIACSKFQTYGNDAGIAEKRGRLRCVTLVKGYFQSEAFHSGAMRVTFALRPGLMRQGRRVVEPSLQKGMDPVFIHVRRKDYLKAFPQAVLPDGYYQAAVSTLKKRIASPFFFIVGDDPEYAGRLFADLEPKAISRSSAETDLAVMASCSAGILSNSTFAWWGSRLHGQGGPYLAPYFWIGWRTREWNPAGIEKSRHLEFMSVPTGMETAGPPELSH